MNEHSDGPKSIEISTEIGTIFVNPTCLKAANLIGPNLNIDGTPVHVTAFFVSSDGINFDLIRQFDNEDRFISETAIRARLIDGRDASLIILGKITQILVPAVSRAAHLHRAVFLEAERRHLENEISALNNDPQRLQTKLSEKRTQLEAIKNQL